MNCGRGFSELLAYLGTPSRIQRANGMEVLTRVIDKRKHSAIVEKEVWKNGKLIYRAYYFCYDKAAVKQREVPDYIGYWDFICPTLEQIEHFVKVFVPLVKKQAENFKQLKQKSLSISRR